MAMLVARPWGKVLYDAPVDCFSVGRVGRSESVRPGRLETRVASRIESEPGRDKAMSRSCEVVGRRGRCSISIGEEMAEELQEIFCRVTAGG